jgi:hypothetical protein
MLRSVAVARQQYTISDFQEEKYSAEHPLILSLNKILEAIPKKESTITIFCVLHVITKSLFKTNKECWNQ